MKIICIGRNYTEHARELNNEIPEAPVVFLKPSTALLKDNKPFYYPDWSKDIHYECELVLKIGKQGKYIQEKFAMRYVQEITVGIDFTARDLQTYQKGKGLPWEIAKAFDNSAVIGAFRPLPDNYADGITFSLQKNGTTVQQGDTRNMMYPFEKIIAYTSQFFTLQAGDLIYTGTPAGVGPVAIGDELCGYLGDDRLFNCSVK